MQGKTLQTMVHKTNIAAFKNYIKSGFEICVEHFDKQGHGVYEIVVERGEFYSLHGFLGEISLVVD